MLKRLLPTKPAKQYLPVFHTIEFRRQLTLDLEFSPTHSHKQFLMRKGARLRSEIKPYVTQTDEGPVEMADLLFEDGTVTRQVPFESFAFVE